MIAAPPSGILSQTRTVAPISLLPNSIEFDTGYSTEKKRKTQMLALFGERGGVTESLAHFTLVRFNNVDLSAGIEVLRMCVNGWPSD